MESNDILHTGTVTGQEGNILKVSIRVAEACAHCSIKNSCTAIGGKDRLMEVPLGSDAPVFEIGETVRIRMRTQAGMKAVFYAYVLPILLLMAVVITLYACTVAEGVIALSALGSILLYYSLLYLFRHRIDRKFSVSAEKTAP